MPDAHELAQAVERGRLLERIAMQRQQLGVQTRPLAQHLAWADQAVDLGRAGINWIKAHPEAVAAGVALLFIRKPLRYLSWAGTGWKLWRRLRTGRNLLSRLSRLLQQGLR